MVKSKNRSPFSSLENALRILNLFSMDETELSLLEISERIEVGKSTAHRLLQTLKSEGFIKKDPRTNLYSLGTSILATNKIIQSRFAICNIASPFLQKLVEESGESAHIAKLQDADVIYLHKIECNHPIRLLSYTGKRNPAFCTGSGQAILAFQSKEVIDKVIQNGLTRYTSKTITSPELFQRKLKQIQKQGYALSIEELHEGVVSISAPIWSRNNRVLYSVSIAGPIQRINKDSISKLAQLVIKTGEALSKHLQKR
jgi:DNA-binding IclR family transcriptional regulator